MELLPIILLPASFVLLAVSGGAWLSIVTVGIASRVTGTLTILGLVGVIASVVLAIIFF